MTTGQRLERDLPTILDELAVSPYPDYIDSVLTTTARRRQRPTWTFPERWIPMTTLTSRAAAVPRTPLRAVAILALLLIALAVGAALLIGSRKELPPPFGRAANGLVAYAESGDIFTVDPAAGVPTAIVRGPETDINPQWSRDGTKLAFERMIDSAAGAGYIYVARADGSQVVKLNTPGAVGGVNYYNFSPDGSKLLISYGGADDPSLLIADTDGSAYQALDTHGPAAWADWRPPDGSEILFADLVTDTSTSCCAIKAIDAKTGGIRTILDAVPGHWRGHMRWSPDGSHISYGEWVDAADGVLTVQTHVVGADGTGDIVLPKPVGATWQTPESWSNDSSRLAAVRGYTSGQDGDRVVAIPVDGHDAGVEIDIPYSSLGTNDPSAWEWAPNDSSILLAPDDGNGTTLPQVLLDPVAGTYRTLPWSSTSLPSWQRLAP